jgi:hypothetical protein|tara:strand:+ start:4059 stop:4220 length:162 start_codon:yes stop_codon:yes gene_type:complete
MNANNDGELIALHIGVFDHQGTLQANHQQRPMKPLSASSLDAREESRRAIDGA